MQHESISSIIEQAKNQRAEYIGGSICKHPLAALLVVGTPGLGAAFEDLEFAPIVVGFIERFE